MNPAPVVSLIGTVYAVRPRDVQAVEARPAQYDGEGKFLRAAVEARPGYTVHDVTVLTQGGGFASVVLSEDALAALNGTLPSERDEVEWPVRPFVRWDGNPGRRFPRVALSLAAEHISASSSRPSGSRVARLPEQTGASAVS